MAFEDSGPSGHGELVEGARNGTSSTRLPLALVGAALLHLLALGALGHLGAELAARAAWALAPRMLTWERAQPGLQASQMEPPDPARPARVVASGGPRTRTALREVPSPRFGPIPSDRALAALQVNPPWGESLIRPRQREPGSPEEPGPPRTTAQPPEPPGAGSPSAEPLPEDPLRMRSTNLAPVGPPREAPSPAPGPRPRVDLTYRPAEGALALPGAVRENRQRPDRGEREPPLADRLIAPRRAAGGIFRVTARGEPEYDGQILRWRPGGRYDYRGPAGTFDAWVGPDGSVAFRDHASVGGPPSGRPSYAPPLEDPSTPHLKPSGGVAMWTLGTFDVTDAVMRRLGQDPYGAEKKRFAEATSSWREGLRTRFREAVRRRVVAEAGLAGPLCRRYDAAAEPGRRAIRQELFQRWDECREDADGRAIREALLGAIRRCGIRYPTAQLASLNRSRRAREAFAP